MIKKITSKRVELPPIFLIENEEDYKTLPKGIPYIVGTEAELGFITVFLEFQVLLKSCMKTNIPIKWLECLNKLGYKSHKTYELHSGGNYWASSGGSTPLELDSFIEEQYIVDFDKLADLKILPKWLDDIKMSIETNIIDEVMFDPLAFNKQLGLNMGSAVLKHNMRNLIINDVSGSIPDGVVMTTSRLIKLMSKKFYADIIITGGETFFVDYDDAQDTDFVELAKKAGRSNEGQMFAEIVKEPKKYNTVISFGDNDSPEGYYGSSRSSTAFPCNFEIETLYSLHMEGLKTNNLTGYSKCFKPKTINVVKDWINSITK